MSETDSNRMSPSTAGCFFGWIVNAPLGLILVFAIPDLRVCLFVLSITVTATFWFIFLKTAKKMKCEGKDLLQEAFYAHIVGLFIGIPTWAEVGLIFSIFGQS
jgi:hypothetical protein